MSESIQYRGLEDLSREEWCELLVMLDTLDLLYVIYDVLTRTHTHWLILALMCADLRLTKYDACLEIFDRHIQCCVDSNKKLGLGDQLFTHKDYMVWIDEGYRAYSGQAISQYTKHTKHLFENLKIIAKEKAKTM